MEDESFKEEFIKCKNRREQQTKKERFSYGLLLTVSVDCRNVFFFILFFYLRAFLVCPLFTHAHDRIDSHSHIVSYSFIYVAQREKNLFIQ